MSQTIDHYKSSLKNAKKNYPHLYEQEAETVKWVLMRTHVWLDWYAGRKGNDEEGAYDFTGVSKIRHRAKRHHMEGIMEIVKILSKRYGERFSKLIKEEASDHVRVDMKCAMKGDIPFASDYPAVFSKHYKD
jgi:hypothetical protein